MNVLFLHIPKCGGTTFHNVLGRMLAAKHPEITIARDQVPDASAFIHGHAAFSDARRAGRSLNDFYSIVMVREPLDRRISEFYFEARHGIGEGTFVSSIQNYMHRNIMMETGLSPDVAGHDISMALDRIDLVFPLEQLDLAIFYLAWSMDLPLPIFPPLNVNSQKAAGILPDERETFVSNNGLDAALYAESIRRFDALIHNAGKRFSVEWRKYQRLLMSTRVRDDDDALKMTDIRLVDPPLSGWPRQWLRRIV